jgi:hypothetical protein
MRQLPKALILSVALVLAACPASGYAQDASSSASASAGNTQTKNIQMVGARASLNKAIDAKKLKQGDPVTAKLQDDVKSSDAAVLPKNTILLGHVDQVHPSENKGDSSVQVTFDKAQLKNGQQLPIKATIVQIAPPPNAMAMNSSSGGASPAMASGPTPSAGGGGSTPSGSGGMQSAQPSPSPSMASNMPDSSQQPQQSGVSDVTLQSDIHQQNSGTFTSKGKNVHLADGTQMQVAVAVIPPNTQIK